MSKIFILLLIDVFAYIQGSRMQNAGDRLLALKENDTAIYVPIITPIDGNAQTEPNLTSSKSILQGIFIASLRTNSNQIRTEENQTRTSSSDQDELESWGSHIQQFIRQINCRSRHPWSTSLGRCESIQLTPFSDMVFYIAPPKRNTVYSAVLPDGDLHDPTQHHSIAVVDPFPDANFGHFVFVFYIDGSTRLWCELNNHRYLGSGLCMKIAKRSHCRNHGRTTSSSRLLAQKCEVNFIPLVYDHYGGSTEHGKKQELICQSGLAGFGECPKQLSVTSKVDEKCELRENTKRCYMKAKVRETPHLPPCRLYQICDHAIAIFGGWSKITMRARNEGNLQSMFNMLRRNGFQKENLQVYYNGNGDVQLKEDYDRGLPASDKATIRNHLHTLCSTPMCVDSLVIYLNGPSTSEGNLLLWDRNGDGVADDNEMYTVTEIMSDISSCSANQVVLLVDQSYSGVFASALRSWKQRTNSLENVALLVSGEATEYSWDQEVTSHWMKLSHLRSISWNIDGIGFVRSSVNMVNRKLAEEYTIYGAPITRGMPQFALNFNSLQKHHMGCQNLPASRSILRFLNDATSDGEN